MSEFKHVEFSDYKVEMHKVRLIDANVLFPYIGSAMTKIAFGNFDFFRDFKKEDIELFEQKLCENCYKLKEDKQEDGRILVTKRNLSLSDLDEHIQGVIPLLLDFLEFNFGFFSLAHKTLEKILPKAFESAEKPKENQQAA